MRTIFQQCMCIYNIHGILGGRHEHAERVLSCEEIHELREKSTKQFHQVSLELLTLDYINFIWNYHPWNQGRGGKCQFDSRKRQIDDNSGFILDFHWFSSLGVGKNSGFSAPFPAVRRSTCWWRRHPPRAGGRPAPFGAADSESNRQVEISGVEWILKWGTHYLIYRIIEYVIVSNSIYIYTYPYIFIHVHDIIAP